MIDMFDHPNMDSSLQITEKKLRKLRATSDYLEESVACEFGSPGRTRNFNPSVNGSVG